MLLPLEPWESPCRLLLHSNRDPHYSGDRTNRRPSLLSQVALIFSAKGMISWSPQTPGPCLRNEQDQAWFMGSQTPRQIRRNWWILCVGTSTVWKPREIWGSNGETSLRWMWKRWGSAVKQHEQQKGAEWPVWTRPETLKSSPRPESPLSPQFWGGHIGAPHSSMYLVHIWKRKRKESWRVWKTKLCCVSSSCPSSTISLADTETCWDYLSECCSGSWTLSM